MVTTAEKRERRAKGICVECREPARPGRARCLKHLRGARIVQNRWYANNPEKCRQFVRNYRERLRAEGRCVACSAPLVGDGRVSCPNCSENIRRPRCADADIIFHTTT